MVLLWKNSHDWLLYWVSIQEQRCDYALTEIVRTLSKSRYKEILFLQKKYFRHNNLRKSLRIEFTIGLCLNLCAKLKLKFSC
jgi:hypothetical protein